MCVCVCVCVCVCAKVRKVCAKVHNVCVKVRKTEYRYSRVSLVLNKFALTAKILQQKNGTDRNGTFAQTY